MSRTRLILLGSFVIAFAAGVLTGLVVSRVRERPPRRSRLASQLNLTKEQQEQMRKIWSDVMSPYQGRRGEGRAALAQERDEAVVVLLTEDQRAKHEAILQDYARKMEELSQERRKRFDEAVERTKRILTPEQARKYEELLKERRARSPGGPPAEHPGRRSPWSDGPRHRRGPSRSKPAAETQHAPQGEE